MSTTTVSKHCAYMRLWRTARKQAFRDSRGNACERCGSTENLELHHRNPDEKLSNKFWAWREQPREEGLAKCDLLCRKCHFKETVKTRGFYRYAHGTVLCYDKTKCRCELCRTAKAVSDPRRGHGHKRK